VDHRFLLVTSANFSWSAEQGNVEFGVLIDNPNLAEAVERELRDAEDALYERVVAHT
jgi:phosphatidylserine/phosphatidylglycerophosphate/cardiolipin synthase-like enzyme